MGDPVFSIERIKRQGREAAERGDLPTVCQYVRGTEPERVWKDAFYVRIYQLSGEQTA